MAGKRAKKTNPHRIPVNKSSIDMEKIIAEGSRDCLYYGWLLVLNALFDLEYIECADIEGLWKAVNEYSRNSGLEGKALKEEMERANTILGQGRPYSHLNPDTITTAAELASFVRRLHKNGYHAALTTICLGMDSTGKFTFDELKRVFLNVDLLQGEIEHGLNSYDALSGNLRNRGVLLEKTGDSSCVITLPD